MKRLLSLAAALVACVCARAVYFTSAPGSVESGQSYTVSAEEWGSGNSTEVYIYKNGSFFAYGSGWGYASAGDSTTDYGAQSVTYEAYSGWYDEWWNYNGGYTSTSVTINQPNNAPTINWNVNPSWVPVGSNYYVQVRGADQDGNLFGVSVWKNGVPYALNGGQNTSEMYSDVNWLAENSTGQITFTAQAYDNSGAQSDVISHTVNIYVPNVAPTITWINYPPQNAFVNQSFAVQARANDGNANLNWIYVWRNDQPFAFNAASGGEAYSDNNLYFPTTPGPVTFKAMAGDSSGADSGFIYGTTQITDRPPTMTPTVITGPTVTWDSANLHYRMWATDPGISGSGTLTMSSTIQDPDANLQEHTLRYRQVSLNPGTWYTLGSIAPTSPGYSSKQVTLTNVSTPGQWDFNAWGTDGPNPHPGESKTVWVYGFTNAATFLGQKINGVTLNGPNPAIPLNSGDSHATAEIRMKNTGSKPWQKSSHRLQAIGPTPLVWGSSVRDMDNSTQVDPEAFPGINDTATFTFTFDIPQAPGNYAFVWKMIEQGIAGDPFFEQATAQVAITVIDTTPPTAPSNLNGGNLTTNSLRLNWTASVENGPTLSYDVYRKINGVMTLVGNTTSTWWDFSGLVSGDTYTFRVIAKDGVGLTGTSADKDITTVYDPNLDNDGDTVANGIEDQLGLNRNDASDVRVFTYTYDKINQLKRGPGGQYNKDAEGNIKEVRP